MAVRLMASSECLDFERLLAPVSEESPAGVNLRDDDSNSDLYFGVLEARKFAREAENLLYRESIAGEEDGAPPLEQPDWKKVKSLAIDVIAGHSKDLWVAAWLIEALVREHGFVGLRDGLRLVREISERYWEGVQPQPDEAEGDDITFTLAQIEGLNQTLDRPLLALPITDSEVGQYSSTDYIAVFELGQDRSPNKSEFDSAAKTTSDEFYQTLYGDIQESREELSALGAVLDDKCGVNDRGHALSPAFSKMTELLEESARRLQAIAPHAVQPPAGEDDEAISGGGVLIAQGDNTLGSGQVATREDAFVMLSRVADFFERTEPHSPVSYGLRQVVNWGRMSLPELLAELISDQTARDDLFRRTGIPQPESKENYD
jgi:type VI secretion system protein ImpA